MSDDKYKKGGVEYQPGRMEKSFDQWVEEEKKEHEMSDETTEGGEPVVKKEVVAPTPKPKTPEEMNLNPKDALDPKIMEEMGAKSK